MKWTTECFVCLCFLSWLFFIDDVIFKSTLSHFHIYNVVVVVDGDGDVTNTTTTAATAASASDEWLLFWSSRSVKSTSRCYWLTISIKKTEDVCVDEKKKLDGDGAVVLMVVHIIRKQNDEHAQSEKKRERATERQRKRQRVAIVVVLGGGGIREANEQNIYNGREKAHFWQSSSLKNNFRRRIIFF